jgi:hypothetical protein
MQETFLPAVPRRGPEAGEHRKNYDFHALGANSRSCAFLQSRKKRRFSFWPGYLIPDYGIPTIGRKARAEPFFSLFPVTRNYLFTFYGIDQLYKTGDTFAMGQDILKAINALKNTAIGRCRDRIDEAARKAREFRGNVQNEETKEQPEPCKSSCGVTSILKRKHGL